jgi:Tfp pilus assembly protein PilN
VRAVNLLPREEAKKSFAANRGVAFGGVGGAALTTAVLASMLMSAGGTVGAKQSELDSLRAQIAAVPAAPVKDTSEEDAFAAEKGARVGALSGALAGRVAWDRVLRQVSLVLPEDVWLTNLAATAPSGDAPSPDEATAAGFTITGATYSQSGVARFLSRLSVLPDLENVRLQSSQSELSSDRELVQFTMVADVRPPGSGGSPPAVQPTTEATS